MANGRVILQQVPESWLSDISANELSDDSQCEKAIHQYIRNGKPRNVIPTLCLLDVPSTSKHIKSVCIDKRLPSSQASVPASLPFAISGSSTSKQINSVCIVERRSHVLPLDCMPPLRKRTIAESNKPLESQPPAKKARKRRIPACTICGQEHLAYQCPALTSVSIPQRWDLIKEVRLCVNCLRDDHEVLTCTFQGCKHCSEKHNTSLHEMPTSRDKFRSYDSETD